MTLDRTTTTEQPPGRSRLAWIIALAGVVLFSALAMILRWWDNENEQRLLQEQTDQAGVVLTVNINQFLEPLAATAQAADVTAGDVDVFTGLADRLMTGADARPYSAIVLVDASSGAVIAERGGPLAIERAGGIGAIDPPVEGTTRIHDLLEIDRTLGFAATSRSGDFVIYAERRLSDDPNVRRRRDGPYAGIDYAVYLGDEPEIDRLLGASTREIPLGAPTASTTVPYGDTNILLVTTPTRRLGDSLLAQLWWIVLVVGITGTAVIAALLARLQASRQRALDLAMLNAQQHREQRDIAETLQLELLPQTIAPPPGVRMATRYWVADTASLIGGDTYDVFQIDEHRWAILVGDVCGKGTEAAALTGLVRHTVRTAARYVDSPAAVLHAVHAALAEHRPATFCTAALMIYRPDDLEGTRAGGALTVSLGGHPAPLIRTADGSIRPIGRPGTLLGLIDPVLHDEHVRIEPGTILLAYTDGLTDAARGRALTTTDLHASLAASGDVDAIANDIRERRAAVRAGGSDDTVILILAAHADVTSIESPAPTERPASVV